jgi:hypothetical protein
MLVTDRLANVGSQNGSAPKISWGLWDRQVYGFAQRLVLSEGGGEGLTSKSIAIWRKCHQCREYRGMLDVRRNHDVNRPTTGVASASVKNAKADTTGAAVGCALM